MMNYTIEWYKGEVFEALITGGFGVVLFIVAFIFWKFGNTPSSQAMVMPLVSVGLILGVSGGYNVYSQKVQINHMEVSELEDSIGFVQSEKARVEGFQYLYTFTKYLAIGLFTGALLIFFFVDNRHWQAIAISMVILGGSGLVIDYFSKERADIYYQHILNRLK